MRFEGPVLSDEGVAEVTDFLEHGVHEGRPQLCRIIFLSLSLSIDGVLCGARVVVEGRAGIEESTTTFHVPGNISNDFMHLIL